MSAKIARINSPVVDGERSILYFETSVDAVIDPKTGESVRKMIQTHTYDPVSEDTDGIMTAEQYKQFLAMLEISTVVSPDKPDRSCTWLKVLDEADMKDPDPIV